MEILDLEENVIKTSMDVCPEVVVVLIAKYSTMNMVICFESWYM